MYYGIPDDESLCHYGVKNMRWGVRRYQNEDGTRTALGKEHRRALEGSSSASSKSSKTSSKTKTSKKSTTKEPETTSRDKRIKDMSEQELRDRASRLQLENQVLNLERQLSSYNPKTLTLGQRFVKSAVNDVIAPAAREAGKTILKDYLVQTGREALGIRAKDDKKDEKKKE